MDLENKIAFFIFLSLTISQTALSSDPDILTDFIIPPNTNQVNASFFTYTGLRDLMNDPSPSKKFEVVIANMEEFPALNGQSVSYAVLSYPPCSVNPVHTHPRSAELLLVISGCLEVGFVDTSNKLYAQHLKSGDIFVFPKGLMHYQYNEDKKNPAFALSAFGSAKAGIVSLPNALFDSSVDDGVLAKSFKSDVETIKKIKAGLSGQVRIQ